jgi:hypothetical protein
MSSSSSSSESLTAATTAALSMDERARWEMASALLKSLKPGGRKAAKTAKDPDAPKREATWWIKGTQHVRGLLTESGVLATENARREAAKESKLPAVAAVQVARILKEAGKLTADISPSAAEVSAAWRQFLDSPPEPKTAELKAAAAEKRSTASAGSKDSNASKADLSEEEKEAKRKEKAAKAKATREANKAKKAAETAATPAAAAAPAAATATADAESDAEEDAAAEADEDGAVDPYEWEHLEFNTTTGAVAKNAKMITYEAVEIEGKRYVYDNETKKFLGLFMGDKVNKLNIKAEDPLA